MWKMIQTEWWKLRRCQILLVGIVALALCPVVQYGTQLIVNPEIRDPNFDFVHLFANVVWGNTQVFLPISLVMIGGWLIDRENTHDTMKNLLTVPVSYPKLLGGKLAVTGLLSLLFGLYSVAVTVLTGALAGLPGLTPGVILQQGGQVVAAALTTFLVCMPMILMFGQMRGAYLGGSILTFFLGYCILFFKSGFLLSAYPFSAALVLAGCNVAQLVMLWKHGRFRVDEFPTGETFTIPADSELTRGVTFTVLPQLAGETFDVGFALRREGYTNWFNGKSVPTEVGNL